MSKFEVKIGGKISGLPVGLVKPDDYRPECRGYTIPDVLQENIDYVKREFFRKLDTARDEQEAYNFFVNILRDRLQIYMNCNLDKLTLISAHVCNRILFVYEY